MKKTLIIILLSAICCWRLHWPSELKTQDIVTQGTISSIPEQYNKAKQWLFITQKTHARIWLSWYSPPPVHLHVGDTWQLHLHIKPATQPWLKTQDVNAAGYVKYDVKNQLIQRDRWHYPINHIREIIYKKLKITLNNKPSLGFISALTVGMRDQITQAQWQTLRNTGTNHLMAIAGLHIGFVVSFLFFLTNRLSRFFPRVLIYSPAQQVAILVSLIGAFCYSALAGFALPTQRAIIMLSVFLFASLCKRHIPLWAAWLTALLFIIAWEPLAVLTASFWLSFSAVALIIYGCSARLKMHGFWWHWFRAQWVIALGLIPVSLLFFQQVSLTGLIANLIAIPYVGFIILPLSLLGIVNAHCWLLAEYLLTKFWPMMIWLGKFPHAQWLMQLHSPWQIIEGTMAIILLLAPRGWPARWLGWIWFAAMFWH